MIKRKLITIYYKNRNQVMKFLSQIGVDVEYTSKKGAYIIAYFDDADQKRIIGSLKKNPLVSHFDISDKELVELDIDRKTVPEEEIEEAVESTPYLGIGEENGSEPEEKPLEETEETGTSDDSSQEEIATTQEEPEEETQA